MHWVIASALLLALSSTASLPEEGRRTISGENRFVRRPKAKHDWTLQRLIILPRDRLLFCYIEKVAGTSFNSLFNQIANRTTHRLRTMWLLNDWRAHRLKVDDLLNLFHNEFWHKAVFFRDPVERFISAYRSKCLLRSRRGRHDLHSSRIERGSWHCENAFGSWNASFQRAVEVVRSVEAIGNAHWLQQFQFCGDLRRHISHFDTIELLEPEGINRKVKRMLRRANVNVTQAVAAAVDRFFPPPNSRPLTDWRRGSFTNASATIQEYFPNTAEGIDGLANVVRHYLEDYKLFNMTLTPWQLRMLSSNTGRYDDILRGLPYLPTL